MLCPVLRDVVLRWAARPHITGTSFFFFLFFLDGLGWVVKLQEHDGYVLG